MKSKFKYILLVVGIAVIIFGALIPVIFKEDSQTVSSDKFSFNRNGGGWNYSITVSITSEKEYEISSAVITLKNAFNEYNTKDKSVNSPDVNKSENNNGFVYTFTFSVTQEEFFDYMEIEKVVLNTSIGTRTATKAISNISSSKNDGWKIPVMVVVITMGAGLVVAGVVMIKSSKQLEERANKARRELAGKHPEIDMRNMSDEEVLMKRRELRMKKEVSESQILQSLLGVEEKPKDKICEYCGSTNPADAKKCSSCGANLKSKK